jgi:chemotaxis response regulator CheB
VESNDSLYGGSADFINILHEMRTTVLNEILTQLSALKEVSVARNYDRAIEVKVTLLALDVISVLIAGMENNEKLDTLLCKMCDLATKVCVTTLPTNTGFHITQKHSRKN